MTREEEVIRGGDARRVLENPMYQEAFSTVKEGIISAMNRSPMGDDKTHNRLVISLQLLTQIESHLKTAMQTGKLAEMQTNDGVVARMRRMVA
jgi:hypothetical protein